MSAAVESGRLNGVKVWLEDLVVATPPPVRELDPFRLSTLAVPLDKAPKLEQTRIFEVVAGARNRTQASITDVVEWWCELWLRIGYMGAQDDRDLRAWMDADFERIDAAVIQKCFVGPLAEGMKDIDFAGMPEPLKTTPGANHQVFRRSYRARYFVPALGV